MCGTCGCGPGAVPVNRLKARTDEVAGLPKFHLKGPEVLHLETEVLGKNSQIAFRNRSWFGDQGILALNLVSSPGAGKTTLLERTIRELCKELEISVIEGDQETANDARRIRDTGAKVIQINTGAGCHLDAQMVERALGRLKPRSESLVMIENVGNLVCPALFDLGERSKVAILSVTEGEDKPLKYPHMFRAAELLLINKIDLLPYVSFDPERCASYAREIHPEIRVLQVSATRGDGLENWYDWIRAARASRRETKNGGEEANAETSDWTD